MTQVQKKKKNNNSNNDNNDNNNVDSLAPGPSKKQSKATLKEFVIALRPWSFPASVVGVLLGSAIAWKHSTIDRQFSFVTLFFTILGALSIHSAGNLTNTYYDFRSGLDKKKTSGDRTLFDTNVKPKQVLSLAVLFYLLSVLVAVYFVYVTITATRATEKVFQLFSLCFLGVLLTFFYTAGPVRLKHRALGDVAIFLCFGPLLVEGTYFLQRFIFSFPSLSEGSTTTPSTSSSSAFWLSFPIGLITEAILHVNNARDIEADRRANALTVARLLGSKLSFYAYVALITGPYVILAVYACYLQALVGWGVWVILVLPLLSLPLAIPLLRNFSSGRWSGNDLCASTGQFGLIFGVLLSISVLLAPSF